MNGLIVKMEMLLCPRLVTYIDLPVGCIRIVPVVFLLTIFSVGIVDENTINNIFTLNYSTKQPSCFQ